MRIIKRNVWFLFLLILVSVAVPVRAESESGISVKVDGVALNFPVPPRKEEGRVLVPMRAIFEALGATIDWNGQTQSIRATAQSGIQVDLRVGSRVAQADGQVLLLDVPPKLIESSTFVPVRFVAEALGATVTWEDATSTVVITSAPASARTPRTTAPGSVEQLLEGALPATVLIEGRVRFGGTWSASGIFLNDKGLIATNYHVLDGASSVEIVTYDRKRYKALKVVAANAAADVAVIETDAVGYSALPLALQETVNPGHSVLTVGNPMGLEWSVTEGIVSSGDRQREGLSWIQHTAPISRGNSGGPLISRTSGRVLGMNTFMLTGTAVQNLNFAIPSSTIAAVLAGEMKQDPLTLPSTAGAPATQEPKPQPTPEPAPAPAPAPAPEPEPPITVNGEWPHFLGDAGNRTYSPISPGLQLKPLWSLSSTVHSASLVLAHGLLVATDGTSANELHAFDPATGKQVWTKRLEAGVSAPVAGPLGFYVSSGGWAMLFKPDGTRVWRTETGGYSPVLSDGKLLLAGNGKAIALNPETGEELWSTLLSGDRYGSGKRIAAGHGKMAVSDWMNVHVLDTATGRFLYTIKGEPEVDPVIDGGLIYLGRYEKLDAYDLATGKLAWSANIGSRVRYKPSIGKGILVLQADDGYIYGYDAKTGKELWSEYQGQNGGGSSTILGDHVFVGGWGGLEVHSLTTGKKVTTIMKGEQVSGYVVATENVLFIPDGQWGLYAMKKDPTAPAVPEPKPETGASQPAQPAATTGWLHFLGDAGNRSYAATGPGVDLKELWRASGSVHSARLLLAHNILFAVDGSSGGTIHGINPDTGKQLWERRLDDYASAPVAGPHGVYVSAGGWVMLFRPDGSRAWRKDLGAGAPILADGKLLVFGRGKAFALNPETGEELWSTVISGDPSTTGGGRLAAADGHVVIPFGGRLHVLDTATGKVIHTIVQAAETPPVIDSGRLYFGGGKSLFAYELATGKQIWAANIGSRTSVALAVAKGTIVAQPEDGYTYGYSTATGKEVWSQERARGTGGSSTILGDSVYIGGWNGLEVLKLATGEKVTSIMPGTQLSGWVVATPDRLYIANGQWGLYALQKR